MPGLSAYEIALQERMGNWMMSVFELMSASAFLGIYLAVFSFTIYTVRKTGAQTFTLALIVILFALSLVLYSLHTFDIFGQTLKFALAPEPWTITVEDRKSSFKSLNLPKYIRNWVFGFGLLTANGVVLWRTWLLWQGALICYLPILLSIASIGLLISERTLSLVNGSYDEIRQYAGVFALSGTNQALFVATNVICTAMFTYRAWNYRQFLLTSLGKSAPAAVILTLLIVTGVIHAVFWSIFIPCNIPTISGTFLEFGFIWNVIAYEITGLIPTILIASIELQRQVHDNIKGISATHPFETWFPHGRYPCESLDEGVQTNSVPNPRPAIRKVLQWREALPTTRPSVSVA